MSKYKNEKPNEPLNALIQKTRKNQQKYTNPIPAVMGIIKHRGKFLAVKDQKTKLYWGFVTGFLEVGESAEKGIEREVKEETGIKAKVKRIIGTFPYFDEKIIIMTVLELKYVSGKVKAGSDAADASWLKLNKTSLRPGSLSKYMASKYRF